MYIYSRIHVNYSEVQYGFFSTGTGLSLTRFDLGLQC